MVNSNTPASDTKRFRLYYIARQIAVIQADLYFSIKSLYSSDTYQIILFTNQQKKDKPAQFRTPPKSSSIHQFHRLVPLKDTEPIGS